MPSRNKVFLQGHLGGDAETKFTPNGVAVTSFSLATTHGIKKPDGNWDKITTWHRVKGWRVPEWMLAHLVKGALVDVEGRISNRSYEKDGVTKYVTEIVADQGGVNWLRPAMKGGARDEDAPPERDLPPSVDESDIPF